MNFINGTYRTGIVSSIIVLFLSVSNPEVLLSQAGNFIKGKVIVAGTSQPVQFATVRLKENKIGVFANAEGDFRITNNPLFRSDSLIVTSIGFRQNVIAVTRLSDTLANMIYMTAAVYDLNEVKVISSRKKLRPTEIVARAIKNLKKNYPQSEFTYTCYYRDYQKKDNNYLNLNEAIIQVLDKGFRVPSLLNSYRLLDFRKNTDFPRVEMSPFYVTGKSNEGSDSEKYIPSARLGDQNGNEFFILLVHDALRNYRVRSFSFVDILSENFILNHYFGEPEPVYDNNLLLYKIFFNAKTKLTGNSFQVTGAIYIQPRDYSIHKLEYTCYYILKGKPKKEMFNLDIEYDYEKSFGSPMYLKYISFNNLFRVVDPADDKYFRVTDSYLLAPDIDRSAVVIVFNNMIDPVSGGEKKNYDITLGEKALKIKSIDIKGKRAIIKLKYSDLYSEDNPVQVYVHDIRNTTGDIVNVRKTVEFNQFRELFVEDYNQPVRFRDSCLMQYAPLEKNCISQTLTSEKYWMNTPERIDNKK